MRERVLVAREGCAWQWVLGIEGDCLDKVEVFFPEVAIKQLYYWTTYVDGDEIHHHM